MNKKTKIALTGGAALAALMLFKNRKKISDKIDDILVNAVDFDFSGINQHSPIDAVMTYEPLTSSSHEIIVDREGRYGKYEKVYLASRLTAQEVVDHIREKLEKYQTMLQESGVFLNISIHDMPDGNADKCLVVMSTVIDGTSQDFLAHDQAVYKSLCQWAAGLSLEKCLLIDDKFLQKQLGEKNEEK